MLGKMELFRRIVLFRLWIHSRLRKLRVEMAHFKKYSSFSEKRHAFVWVKWWISVQPLHNIIILIGSKTDRRTSILAQNASNHPKKPLNSN